MAAKKVNIRLVKSQKEMKKKIESPLAKYNSAGQLFCVLCDIPIKSAILWTSHVLGRKHKENLANLKGKSSKDQPVTEVKQTPKLNTTHVSDSTFVSPALKRTSQDKVETNRDTSQKKIKVDSSDKTNSDHSLREKEHTDPAGGHVESSLPSDFFDNPKKSEQDEQKIMPSDEPTEGIPEGFFDDPRLDAKVRKVDYKDATEEEWEKFQKEMQVETQVSQSIVEGEDEESRVDRELSELSEQRLYFLRADALRDKQSAIKEKVSQQEAVQRQSQVENSSNSDDSDFEEFLDWRAKKVS
ncbi:zinc finger protein 830-like [Oculina patagonica]